MAITLLVFGSSLATVFFGTLAFLRRVVFHLEAAKLTRGCTSGQALSGGAVQSVGSWAFMLSVFAGGYAAAYFVRRQWR